MSSTFELIILFFIAGILGLAAIRVLEGLQIIINILVEIKKLLRELKNR